MTICQSTRRHIAEDLNLANIRRYEHHEGVWGSGSTGSLILTVDIIWRLSNQLHAAPALSRGKFPLDRKVSETLNRYQTVEKRKIFYPYRQSNKYTWIVQSTNVRANRCTILL
jgi:hypothetical protein